MEKERIYDPKIDFEEDNTNSIFFEEIKTQEIAKLKKKNQLCYLFYSCSDMRFGSIILF